MQFIQKHKILTGFFVVALILLLLFLNAGPLKQPTQLGVTFSIDQAKSLGLNWQDVYASILDDLKIKNIRLSAYWNQTEPEDDKYNFKDLDYMLDEAAKRDVDIVLAIGRRLPRWPECHDPAWIKEMNETQLESSLLSYLDTVVSRYKNHSAIKIWQVENEPFLGSFGECPKPNSELLDKEIALVKKLDPSRPVLISDSGEISFWIHSGKRGDIFGTTLYRYVYSDIFNRYWMNYIPFWFYRVKAGLLRALNGNKQIVIIELQAEPWTTKGITNTSVDEQFRTMSLEKFNNMLGIANATGFSPQYLWGVEWWYYMKETGGHPEFWEKVRELVK